MPHAAGSVLRHGAGLGHVLAYVLAGAVLGLFTGLAGGFDRTGPLWEVLRLWTIVLAVDFAIAFSCTFAPRRPRIAAGRSKRA